MNRWWRKTSRVLMLFLIVAAIALVVSARQGLRELVKLQQIKDRLIESDLKLVEENRRLHREREELKTSDYVDTLSRDNLGLAKPDDTIYIVEEPKEDELR